MARMRKALLTGLTLALIAPAALRLRAARQSGARRGRLRCERAGPWKPDVAAVGESATRPGSVGGPGGADEASHRPAAQEERGHVCELAKLSREKLKTRIEELPAALKQQRENIAAALDGILSDGRCQRLRQIY